MTISPYFEQFVCSNWLTVNKFDIFYRMRFIVCFESIIWTTFKTMLHVLYDFSLNLNDKLCTTIELKTSRLWTWSLAQNIALFPNKNIIFISNEICLFSSLDEMKCSPLTSLTTKYKRNINRNIHYHGLFLNNKNYMNIVHVIEKRLSLNMNLIIIIRLWRLCEMAVVNKKTFVHQMIEQKKNDR